MTLQGLQAESPSDTKVFISYKRGSREIADLLAFLGREGGHPRKTTYPNTLPAYWWEKGTAKGSITDHLGWSAYLFSRRILGPAIAAGAWVEREQWTGQDVLIWRARRRNGRPGATRRRLLKTLKI
ncbi:MAG: hypothetical protein J4G18_08010 [Anaerolineae bacterium]|nr:hypothetical protein [Anaerolineae bacterium]